MKQSSRPARTQDQAKVSNDTETPSPAPIESRGADPNLIAQAAYGRYEARGREDGHDVEDWLAAEREVRRGSASDDATDTDESDAT